MASSSTGPSNLSRALSIFIILSVLGAIGFLAYSIASPATGQKFTEFYILNSSGNASSYPSSLKTNEDASVIVGIINREQQTTGYRVEVEINGQASQQYTVPALANGAKTEKTVTFRLTQPGNSQKVQFLLYKQGQDQVYHSLYILVNVSQ